MLDYQGKTYDNHEVSTCPNIIIRVGRMIITGPRQPIPYTAKYNNIKTTYSHK